MGAVPVRPSRPDAKTLTGYPRVLRTDSFDPAGPELVDLLTHTSGTPATRCAPRRGPSSPRFWQLLRINEGAQEDPDEAAQFGDLMSFYAELMSFFSRYEEPGAGFRTVAGPEQGLTGFLVATGRLAAGEGGPLHLHHGDEVLRILSGDLEVTVGDEVRLCGAGDIVAVPADTLHGFQTITEVRLEVVAVRDAGQVFPVYLPDGSRQLNEVYRQDMPWSRTPPAGFGWTTDEQMADVLRHATPPDHSH
jgi:mannose-6-phosphate isomerase-like protein (cupin superfamily)